MGNATGAVLSELGVLSVQGINGMQMLFYLL